MFQLIIDILNGGIARDMETMPAEDKPDFIRWMAVKLFWFCVLVAVVGTGAGLLLTN